MKLEPLTSSATTPGTPIGAGMLSSETGFMRLGRKSLDPLVLVMASVYQLENEVDGTLVEL